MELDSAAIVGRNSDGVVRSIGHFQRPFPIEGEDDPRRIAGEYLRELAEVFGFDEEYLAALDQELSDRPTGDPTRLVLTSVRELPGSTVVGFTQTVRGLPVWRAGVTVRVALDPARVLSVSNTTHGPIEVSVPNLEARTVPDRLDVRTLSEIVETQLLPAVEVADGFEEIVRRVSRRVRINASRLLVYRYSHEDRLHSGRGKYDPKDHRHVLDYQGNRLVFPRLPDQVIDGEHHVVTEVLWTAGLGHGQGVHIRMLVEPETEAILYFRMLFDEVDGKVYLTDPATKGSTVTPTSPVTDLDNLRDTVPLPGLTAPSAGNPQELTGGYVELQDIDSPTIPPPTSTGDFFYTVPSNDFGAVGAYFHSDRLFRMVEDFGFNMGLYFDGTSFPVPIDHRSNLGCDLLCAGGDCVNAKAPGNATGDGSLGFRYALAQAGTLVSITTSWRVVLHEFGHAILHDNVHSGNFEFAHSCGDSLAVILNDPGTLATDRFRSFPWITAIDRRHDRTVAAGWFFGGAEDDGDYGSEQILSTIMFRAYRFLGGDSPNLTIQRLTADYVAYLLFHAVGALTPATSPTDPADFAAELVSSDVTTTPFAGVPGGWAHKVVRWAFEKQDVYGGDPPDVDVFIDDGRSGEYEPFLNNFWNTTDIWNRLGPDGGLTHVTPVVGVKNYAYVRVNNRGQQNATNVVVRGYQCKPMAGLEWPTSWDPWTTASIAVPGSIAPGVPVVVGPFEWVPDSVGHECMLAMVDATGAAPNLSDLANDSTISAPIGHWRLVPFDNNIAQRNVAPVAGGGGGSGLTKSFAGRTFWVRNPLDNVATIELVAKVPAFLLDGGWKLRFADSEFEMEPGEEREIALMLSEGRDFTADDVERAGGADIGVVVNADGLTIGGMTYSLDPSLVEPPREYPGPGSEPAPEHGPCSKPGLWNWILCLILKVFRFFRGVFRRSGGG